MTDPSPSQNRAQALRLKRFAGAGLTYLLGFLILALCSGFGLLPRAALGVIGTAFVGINVVLFCVFRSGLNLRFRDPSLTQFQVCVAVSIVCLILVLGERIHFVAVPFYSSLFVFAMLRLRPRELIVTEIYVLGTYCAAVAVRSRLFADSLDLRIEAINAALVVLSSIWYAVAAGYISNLRARLRESLTTIERLATRDEMTDTWNRRHIDALLGSELKRQERLGGDLCVGLVDVDHFKAINDRFGHLAGDAVLARIAATMKAQLRAVDQLGRFGGEEFLVVLPGTSRTDAMACAERLRRSVAALSAPGGSQDPVTVSIGLAESTPGQDAGQLLARVDAAMYEAKWAGRNRVVIDTDKGAGGPERTRSAETTQVGTKAADMDAGELRTPTIDRTAEPAR